MKKNKGITLIALVITIIILLILAGISIATLTGENGLLTKAGDSKEKTEITDTIERARVDILGVQAENKSGDITKGQLIGILKKYFKDVPTVEELPENLATVMLTTKEEYGSHAIKISDIWNGTFAKELNKTLAKDVLKTDATAIEEASKSPYVKYNGLDCRVLYNDDIHEIQIIAARNVEENLKLGSSDTEVTAQDFTYTGKATVDDSFQKAAASYNNVVDNLNKRAKTYMDTKGITTDARCLGSVSTLNGNGKFKGDEAEMWSSTYTYLETYSWNNKFKNIDTNYLEDVKQLNDLGLNVSSGYTWLASRYIYSGSGNVNFYVRYVSSSGYTDCDYLCNVNSGGTTYGRTLGNGFRPVFLLPSHVIINSGEGSSGNPYIIE